MTSQPVPNETMIVLPSNVINFSQAEKPKPTNQGQGSLKKRLQAEVKVIGTIQILCGVMVLSLGIMLASASFSPNFTQVTSTLLNSAYPFIGPFFFIISGSLSIATEKRLTKLLVHSSLVGSILSALSALVGFIILSVELAALNPASLQWNSVSDANLHSAGILPSCAHCCAVVETGLL
uniref:Membrane spanning 4-domains A6A n=1 Tax=Papio anubis TaxID=9555 RepID=A0A8I5N601_PAPAN